MRASTLVLLFTTLLSFSACQGESQSPSGSAPSAPSTPVASEGTAPGDSLLPRPVVRTRARLLEAARAQDYDVLAQEIARERAEPFLYSFGFSEATNPIAYWKDQAAAGEDPLQILHTILRTLPVRQNDTFLWPSWAETPLVSLSPAERQQVIDLVGEESFAAMRELSEYYTGPRTAIRNDGLWMFYLSGD